MEIKGFTYGYSAKRGDWRSPEGIKSQDALYELGNNWVCLSVLNYQDKFYSTQIKFDFVRTPTDKDVAFAVEKAHSKGVKVCLKPMLNSDDHMWRAHIGFPDKNMGEKDGYWNDWFKSYTNFMVHYAELAEDLKVEMLCIGCEMLGTEHKEEHWRTLIAKLRKIYSGKMVYNTNHGKEDSAKWFDALDYLGTSAYYSVGKKRIGGECTADGKGDLTKPIDKVAMTAEWEKIRKRVNGVADKLGKKYIFMEIGCRSATGCSAMPWDFAHRDLPWSEDEQATFYETCLDVFGKEKRFAGVFWWDWSTFIYDTREQAQKDIGFNVHLKKAEEILKTKYRELS
ncbi:MAG: glycosyl hydrolase family 53 [Oscillospiraceae bacterium]|nr:glycosyl hydrolase family 53 [Oscillospiraceae bacterium]